MNRNGENTLVSLKASMSYCWDMQSNFPSSFSLQLFLFLCSSPRIVFRKTGIGSMKAIELFLYVVPKREVQRLIIKLWYLSLSSSSLSFRCSTLCSYPVGKSFSVTKLLCMLHMRLIENVGSSVGTVTRLPARRSRNHGSISDMVKKCLASLKHVMGSGELSPWR